MFWPDSAMLVKLSVFARILHSARPLTSFLSTAGPYFPSNPDGSFLLYTNSRLLINNVAEKYGEWLDRSNYVSSNYLK